MDHLNRYIDHTYLQAITTDEVLKELCEQARKFQFASVCVHPYFVRKVREELAGTKIGIGTVVGFPLGANCMETKLYEVKKALDDGATEIDFVMNLSAMRNQEDRLLKEEFYEIKALAQNEIVKVILETCYLTRGEKIKACELAIEARIDFVKTSTGFGPKGATVEDVELLRKVVGSLAGVKASGGIRDKETAMSMIRAGANRIGTSSGVSIMES